jgi:hypothetical protein
VRWILLCLALAACGKPCRLACANDADCGGGFYCLNQVYCLPGCYACAGVCITSVHDNCGPACHACASNQFCSQGSCVSGCASGETDCAGACMNLATDRLNCGACNNVCAREQTCAGGRCTAVDTCQ